jgi:hypothetical protein
MCSPTERTVTISSDALARASVVTAEVTPFASSLLAPNPATGGAAALAAGGAPRQFVHTLDSGDTLVSIAESAGNDGTVVLKGAIGPFPYEVEIKVTIVDARLTVTLHVRKPFELGPYEWRFDLGGVRRNASGEIVGASAVTPEPTLRAVRLDWWCVLRCGGTSILGALIKCLPSLTGGPQAYIACVVGLLGTSAADIAKCIATKCL